MTIDRYLLDLVKVLGIGAGFASIPFLAGMAGLQPPWPPAIAPLSAAFILLAALAAWEWVRADTLRQRRRWIVAGAVLALVGLLPYLVLHSLFVEPVPGSDLQVIRGFTCTAEARLVYPGQCPDLPREALRDAEWEAPVLWTRASITVVRLGLAAGWLLFTAGIVCAVGSIVAGRKLRRKARAPAGDQP